MIAIYSSVTGAFSFAGVKPFGAKKIDELIAHNVAGECVLHIELVYLEDTPVKARSHIIREQFLPIAYELCNVRNGVKLLRVIKETKKQRRKKEDTDTPKALEMF